MRLTKRIIEGLECPQGAAQGWFFDEALPGFGLRVFAGGRRSYVVRATIRGRRRLITIGDERIMGLESARDKARVILGEVAGGKDPAQELQAKKTQGLTLADLIERYRNSDHGFGRIKPKTRGNYNHFIEKVLMPSWGRRDLASIVRNDVEAVVTRFKNQKSAKTGRVISGARANRLKTFIHRLFELGMQWGMVPVNPCRGIEHYREVARSRIATEQETARILAAIEKEPIVWRALFRVLWLTMARSSEIREAQWSQVDLEAGLIRLPETKSGRPFVVRLPPDAVEIMRELPRFEGNPFVFVGAKEGKPVADLAYVWRRICERAGVQGLNPHDIRRSGASMMIMNGASLQEVADLLNHSALVTTQRYARLADGFRARKIEEHQDRLRKLAGGSLTRSGQKKD